MPVSSYQITCLKKTLIATAVYELAFAKPAGFSFKAGQFVLFDVPLLENPSDIQTRAYSVASSPDETELLFVIKLKEGGRAGRWVEHLLQVGTVVVMKGPIGVFTLRPGSQPCVFVATGSGIAPFRSLATWALINKAAASLTLIFGVRNREDLFWKEYFESLAGKYPTFTFIPTLSNPNESWKGACGRVQPLLQAHVLQPLETKLYACGSPAMVTDTKKFCLEVLRMPKENVHCEGYS